MPVKSLQWLDLDPQVIAYDTDKGHQITQNQLDSF